MLLVIAGRVALSVWAWRQSAAHPSTDTVTVTAPTTTPDTPLADTQAQLIQFFGHARPTIAAQAAAMLAADMGQDHHVTTLTG